MPDLTLASSRPHAGPDLNALRKQVLAEERYMTAPKFIRRYAPLVFTAGGGMIVGASQPDSFMAGVTLVALSLIALGFTYAVERWRR